MTGREAFLYMNALVLGGGGSRGAYEIGVWRALREMDHRFSIVTGTSVGALNGAIIAQGDYQTAVDVWSSITTDMVLSLDEVPHESTLRERLTSFGLFAREIAASGGADSTPLRNLLRELLDEDRIRSSDVRFGLVTVQLPAFEPHAVFASEIEHGQLLDYVLASAACFPAMQKQMIGHEAYIDGGYFDNLPVELAVRGGATSAIAVDVHGIGLRRRAESAVPVRMITTGWSLGSILHFDAENARRSIELGYLDTCKSFGQYEGRLYTFGKGEAARLLPVTERMHVLYDELFPPAKSGVGLHDLVRRRTMRFLRGTYRSFLTTPSLFTPRELRVTDLHLAAAESAGRTLGLSPIEVYTASSFREAACRAWLSAPVPELSELERIFTGDFSPEQRAEELLAAAGGLTPLRLTRWIGSILDRPDMPRARLAALCTAMPAEFLAALFIRACLSSVQ